MLQINNLTISHNKDLRTMLENFNLTLNYGDRAVIIGEEGNGKSTLIKWIYDPEMVADYADCSGTRILQQEVMAYLPQELPKEHKEKTVYEFFCQEPNFFEQNPGNLSRMAKDFSMEKDFFYSDQLMGTLSGGEKVKAQLMAILMREPTVLLLDEPTNDLDIETLKWLEQFINNWRYIVLYVSHDETLIENTANKIIHLEMFTRKTKCKYTVATSTFRQYAEERLNQFDRQRQQALNDRREKRIRDDKLRRISQKVERAQNKTKDSSEGRTLKKKMHVVKSMERRFEKEDDDMTRMPKREKAIDFRLGTSPTEIPSGKVILDYSLDALYSADGARVLARNINLRLRGCEKVCIIGSNGTGKTTLLKDIAPKLMARKDITAAYIPQNYDDVLKHDITPVEYLQETGSGEEREEIRTYLGALRYTTEEMSHPVRELSGGQKAKLLLLKIIFSNANVIILDEPTRNVSPLSAPVIRKFFTDFPGAIISVSHDRKYIEEVCDKVYKLTEEGIEEIRELAY